MYLGLSGCNAVYLNLLSPLWFDCQHGIDVELGIDYRDHVVNSWCDDDLAWYCRYCLDRRDGCRCERIDFERIREELKEGRSPQQAIHQGYANAFSTIADANITTLITAIILFAVGTGAIKGFAVTLSIGILTSMFTAIIGTRCVVNLMYGGKRNIKKLSI